MLHPNGDTHPPICSIQSGNAGVGLADVAIQAAIDTYLQARHEILELGRLYPGRIGGNDNIIGRIGEFIALRFLERRGRQPVRVIGGANPGFDLIEGSEQIQVKVITEENQYGRSVRLTDPWTEFMLVELGAQYSPTRIGLISKSDHRRAYEANKCWSPTPFVKRTMLGPKGLIGRYGHVYTGEEINI